MHATDKPRVKICCIQSRDEAWLAIDAGASAIGLVSKMPSGPGVIPDDSMRAILAIVPPPIATFLLTSETDVETIVALHHKAGTTVIQLVDDLQSGTYQQIKDALPGISIVQVIHVTGEGSIAKAETAAKGVDALLLDSGNQNLQVKELGGTGRVHDWTISRIIRERISIPLFLAGGLTPENVKSSIATVQPFGVDVCSGVRTNGILDPVKLKSFFDAVHS